MFHRAIRKYGIDNWTTEILETIDNDLLNEKEKYWIEYFDSFKNGYNSTTGGEYYVINEEGRKKMSEAYDENRKREYSERMKIKAKSHPKMLERYERMKGTGNHNFGKHLTEEQKENISKHQKLLKDNEETKMKKSVSKLGEKNPNYGKKGCFDHINKIKFQCNVCGIETTKGNISRWHNEKCKHGSPSRNQT